MRINEIIDAYVSGPNVKESNTMKKTRKQIESKLLPYAEWINKYRAESRSLQYICDRMTQNNICCNRSTLLRFLRKQREL